MRKNNRRELPTAILFMHVFCEDCIEMALFGVTLVPFLPENWPSRSLHLQTIQWYMNVDADWIKISGGNTDVLQWN